MSIGLFPQPLGHSMVQQQLAQLLAQGQFPHALLLHGSKGVGKATLAHWLAARLICGAAEGARNPLTPNKNTPQWAQLQAQSCPDFYVLMPPEDEKKGKTIGIKVVQELLENLIRSADTARVVVLDAVDDLTPEAANTLLKNLEEPRPGVYFVLVCHQLSKALPTLRSRCRLVRMGVLSPNESAAVLAAQSAEAVDEDTETGGAPGWWLGQTAAQRAALQGLKRHVLPSSTVPNLMPMLLHHVANLPPHFATAQLYQKLAQLQNQQQAINLPIAMVQALALREVANHWKVLGINPEHETYANVD